jgi:exosortase C (VPDSG-CTERM-specific)
MMMVSFLLFFFGVCCLFLGREILRAAAFPLGFLIFMVPIPSFLMRGIDVFLQYGSAVVARGFFRLSGTPLFENGLVFQLPGITIQIAPECSGIHSSLVLFIISLLASYVFLRTPWKRAVFILAVIPLGILRNGFRVFTIGELCVHLGPQMINSPIHRKGGPIFFVLSLIPIFILLVMLQKSDQAGGKSKPKTSEIEHA